MAVVTVTETPQALDVSGALEVGIRNTGTGVAYVNSHPLQPGAYQVVKTNRGLIVRCPPGVTTTVSYGTSAPVRGRVASTVADLFSAATPDNPVIIPHRGAGELMAPDNTMEAFKLGASWGFGCIDAGDYYTMTGTNADLAACHNATVDFMTTSTGNVDTFTPMSFRNLTVDCASWFGGTFTNTKPVTLDDVCRDLGGKTILIPEIKTPAGAEPLIRVVQRYGLQKSTLPSTFSNDLTVPNGALPKFVAAGMDAMWVTSEPTPSRTPQQMLAAGVKYVCFDVNYVADQVIQRWVGAGLTVGVFSTTRHYYRDRFAPLGVKFYYSQSPVYFSRDTTRYQLTRDPWASPDYYHGHLVSHDDFVTAVSDRGSFETGGWYRFPVGPQDRQLLLGFLSPLPNTAWTVDIDAKFTTLSTDTTRYLGFTFSPTDYPFNNRTTDKGVSFILRCNGQLQFYVRDGSGTVLSSPSVNTGAITAGTTTHLKIAKAADGTLTVTRNDAASTNTTPQTIWETTVSRPLMNQPAYMFTSRADASNSGVMDISLRNIIRT